MMLFCLQITQVTHPDAEALGFQTGAFLREVYADPAHDWGDMTSATFESCSLLSATFYATNPDAYRAKADAATKVFGVVAEVVAFEETPL